MSEDFKSPPKAQEARVFYKIRRGMLTRAGAPVLEVQEVRRQRSETIVDRDVAATMAAIAAQHPQAAPESDSSPTSTTPRPEEQVVIFARFDPQTIVEEIPEAIGETSENSPANGPRYNRKLIFVILGAVFLAEVVTVAYIERAIITSVRNHFR